LLPSSTSEKKAQRVTNVTFTLNSLHGDADLFVSRVNKYPNKMDYEKNSVRSGDNLDIVMFDDLFGKDDLAATYYIGVYSF
jgi:hypothetical protein